MRMILSLAACLLSASSLIADSEDLSVLAEDRVREGDLAGAERVYDEMISADPRGLDALLGRAFVRSWRGKHDDARRDFEAVLERDPTRLDALVGLGYDLAWSGRYEPARGQFLRALEIAPESGDARKGLAFALLWSERSQQAATEFEALLGESPDSAEIAVALGQARLGTDRPQRAREAFERALEIEPGRTDALEGLNALRNLPPKLELNVWGGSTSGDGGSGLRAAEVAGWPTRRLRLWARFDDSLSLDNPALNRSGQDASAYLAGVLFGWSDRWMAKLEAGRRDLERDLEQDLYLGELVYATQRYWLKLGGLAGPREDDVTDRNMYLGIGRHLSPRWRIEPVVYLSEIGAAKDEEIRGVVNAEHSYRRGFTLGFGAGGGRVSSDSPAADGSLWTAHAMVSAPAGFHHRVFVLVRHEDLPTGSYTVGSVGFSLRLPR